MSRPPSVSAAPALVRPAATLMLLREREGADPEVLMAQRGADMAFAGGAMVFPGGAVDEGDVALARDLAPLLDVEDGAGRVAAIRETLEECGIAAGFAAAPGGDVRREMRAALAAGEEFRTVLAQAGACLALDRLVPFARWRPPAAGFSRIFDTRFYCIEADDGMGEAEADGVEMLLPLWTGAAEILASADAGQAKLIFPTFCNLHRLAQFSRVSEILDHARATPVSLIEPRVEKLRDGVEHLTIPEGLGYPFTALERTKAMRG